MIRIDNKEIELNHFLDNTFHLKTDCLKYNSKYYQKESASIIWNYEGPEELTALIYIVGYLRDNGVNTINLYLPYIPNARMDRVETKEEVFTLKYFCQTINWLNFNKVVVFDPHSSVSVGMLNKVEVVTPEEALNNWLNKIKEDNPDFYNRIVIYYPDEGSMKRYSKMLKMPYVFGNKFRDWETGKILNIDIAGDKEEVKAKLKDKTVLIIDDICSKGGTFYHGAKKLKEYGVQEILLYVSHCEKTIFDGDMIKSGLISFICTTDSIFNYDFDAPENVVNAKYKDIFKIIQVFVMESSANWSNWKSIFGGIF